MRKPLYEIDHGAAYNGTSAVKVRGWVLDANGKRHEEVRHLPRFCDERTIDIAKEKIAQSLGAI